MSQMPNAMDWAILANRRRREMEERKRRQYEIMMARNQQQAAQEAAERQQQQAYAQEQALQAAEFQQQQQMAIMQANLGTMGRTVDNEQRFRQAWALAQNDNERAAIERQWRAAQAGLDRQQQQGQFDAGMEFDRTKLQQQAEQFAASQAQQQGQFEAGLGLDLEQLQERRRQFDAGVSQSDFQFARNFDQRDQELADRRRQFGMQFGEGQRQFDIGTGLDRQRLANQMQQFQQGMALDRDRFTESQRQFNVAGDRARDMQSMGHRQALEQIAAREGVSRGLNTQQHGFMMERNAAVFSNNLEQDIYQAEAAWQQRTAQLTSSGLQFSEPAQKQLQQIDNDIRKFRTQMQTGEMKPERALRTIRELQIRKQGIEPTERFVPPQEQWQQNGFESPMYGMMTQNPRTGEWKQTMPLRDDPKIEQERFRIESEAANQKAQFERDKHRQQMMLKALDTMSRLSTMSEDGMGGGLDSRRQQELMQYMWGIMADLGAGSPPGVAPPVGPQMPGDMQQQMPDGPRPPQMDRPQYQTPDPGQFQPAPDQDPRPMDVKRFDPAWIDSRVEAGDSGYPAFMHSKATEDGDNGMLIPQVKAKVERMEEDMRLIDKQPEIVTAMKLAPKTTQQVLDELLPLMKKNIDHLRKSGAPAFHDDTLPRIQELREKLLSIAAGKVQDTTLHQDVMFGRGIVPPMLN